MSKYRTKQRELLLNYLKSKQGTHLSAAEIADHFREQSVPIGLTTIYRQLENLVQEGLIERFVFANQSAASYQYLEKPLEESQIHFHCEACQGVFQVECHELEHIQSHMLNQHGLQLDLFKTLFYGICPRCSKEQR